MKYLAIILLVLFCGCKNSADVVYKSVYDTTYVMPATLGPYVKTCDMEGHNDTIHHVFYLHITYHYKLCDSIYVTGGSGQGAMVGYFPSHISQAFSFGDSILLNMKYIHDTVFYGAYSHTPRTGLDIPFEIKSDEFFRPDSIGHKNIEKADSVQQLLNYFK